MTKKGEAMIITMPKILTDKLGDDGAEALIHVINEAESSMRTDLATKADLSEMKAELLKWMVIMWITQISAIALLFIKK